MAVSLAFNALFMGFSGWLPIRSAKAGVTKTKTVEFFIGQDQTGGTGVAANADWSKSFSIELPDAVAGAPIKSAWIDYAFQMGSTAAAGAVSIGLTPQGQGEAVFTSAAYLSSGENFTIMIKPDFTAAVSSVVSGPGTYNFTFRARVPGCPRKMENAKLFVTYDYDSEAATQLNTVRYMIGQASGNVAVGTAGTTFTSPNLAIAENSPTVVSAWAEIRGQVPATATTDNVFAVNYDADATSNYYLDNVGGTDKQAIYILHPKNSLALNASHTLKVAATAGYQINLVSAEQIITYKFNYANSANLTATGEVMLGSNGLRASAAALEVTDTVTIPEDSPAMKNVFLRATGHAVTAGTFNVAARLGPAVPVPTANYSYAAAVEEQSNFWILSNDINDLNSLAKGDNQVSATFAGTITSRAFFLVYTYSFAKSSLDTSGRASFWAGQQTAYGTANSQAVNINLAGGHDPASLRSFVWANSIHGVTQDRAAQISTQPTPADTYNWNATGEYQWVRFFHKNQAAEISGNGSYTLNLDSTGSNVMAAGVGLSWIYRSGSLTIGATAGPVLAGLDSGAVSQAMNDPACNNPSACSAFTLATAGPVTLTSIKLSETGSADAVNDLGNLALFYDTDGNYSNGVTGQFGGTVADFVAGETATVTGSLALAPASTYYFYIRFDLRKGANYPVGGQTVNFQIASASDVTAVGGGTISGAPATLAGTATVRPDATATTWGAGLSDGGRSGESITISGYGFGAVPGGSRSNCAGGPGTGCIRFAVGGTATVAEAQVTTWSNTAIAFTIAPDLASYGGGGAIEVTAAGQADEGGLDFIIYPKVTAVLAVGSNAAREYAAGDTDGLVMLSGDHLGAAGTVTILGSPASEHGTAEGSCSSGGYNDASACLEVPAGISDSLYTGNIVLARTADGKTHVLPNFRILPRLSGLVPASGAAGDPVTLNGDHLCQSGVCPAGFDANNKVVFAGADATAFDSWSHTAIVTAVPAGAADGEVAALSNTYASNGKPFSVLSPVPNDPTDLGQFKDAGLTDPLAVGQGASSTPLYLALAMQADFPGGTLYPQIEYKPVGTGFACSGNAACLSAIEGPGKAAPGPVDCSQPANGCAIAISPADDVYHWQARVRHNKAGVDYYSSWVPYGGNGEGAADFSLDATAPAIAFGGGNACVDAVSNLQSNQATLGWSLSESASGQVEYGKASNLADASLFPLPAAPAAFNHSLTLANLDSNTTYYFRVRSTDAAGNTGQRPAVAPFCTFTTQNVTQPAKTVKFYAGGAAGQVAGGTLASSTFLIHLPESSVAIKSAFLELTGISAVSGINDIAVQVNGQAAESTAIESKDSGFKILYKILPANLNLDPVANTLAVTPSLATDIISARVIVTYAFTP